MQNIGIKTFSLMHVERALQSEWTGESNWTGDWREQVGKTMC